MRGKAKQKKEGYYAIARGKQTGIFSQWIDCADFVTGVESNIHQKFATLEQAKEYLIKKGITNPYIHPDVQQSNTETKSPEAQVARPTEEETQVVRPNEEENIREIEEEMEQLEREEEQHVKTSTEEHCGPPNKQDDKLLPDEETCPKTRA